MFLVCCHKPSLYMCSSLYRTVSSLCFQFPKSCWHLEKRPHKPVESSIQVSEIPEYQDMLDVTDVLGWTDTAFMTGYLLLTYWGQRRRCCCRHWLTVSRQALCGKSQIWNSHINWYFSSEVQECKVCPWNESQTILSALLSKAKHSDWSLDCIIRGNQSSW